MTVSEAAEALGLSLWYVRNMCRLGKIPARRMRKVWMIPVAYINDMEDGAPNAAYLEWEREHGKIPATK